VLRGEATNTYFIVFGFEPTIYRTRGEHTYQYITDAVVLMHEESLDRHNELIGKTSGYGYLYNLGG